MRTRFFGIELASVQTNDRPRYSDVDNSTCESLMPNVLVMNVLVQPKL
jgi:hypothetical protein